MNKKQFIKFLRGRGIYNQFISNCKKEYSHRGYVRTGDDEMLDELKYNVNDRISMFVISSSFVWAETKQGKPFWAEHNRAFFSECNKLIAKRDSKLKV